MLGDAGLYFGIKGCVLFHVDMVCSSSDKLCHGAVGGTITESTIIPSLSSSTLRSEMASSIF